MSNPNLVQTYVIHDSDPTKRGATRINRDEAASWNEKGYGVFHTVNHFKYGRRKNQLVAINAWAIDMDGKSGTKAEQWALIEKGLPPTMVVETKSGYHVYWRAKDGSGDSYRSIVENRLVPFYKADNNAKDVARLLRTPGFLHLKDPANPFLVKKVHEARNEYSEREICSFYPDTETPKKQKRIHRKTLKENPMEGGFWDLVWALNCQDALIRLSGTDHVGGEVYDFSPNNSGTMNIIVNGKMSSCWIDVEGRIGSADSGGPTIAQWLNWFHKDYKKTIAIIREVFPECKEKEQLALL